MHLRLFCTTHATASLPSIYHQFSRQFYFLRKMNGGGKSRSTVNSIVRRDFVGADGHSFDFSTVARSGNSRVRRQISQPRIVDNVLKNPKSLASSDPDYEEEWPSLSASISVGLNSNRRTKIDLRTRLNERADERKGVTGSLQLETSPIANSRSQADKSSLPNSFGKKHVPYPNRRPKLHQTYPAHAAEIRDPYHPVALSIIKPFDICLLKSRNSVVLKASLHAKSREKQTEMEHCMEDPGQVLRPGMVLLKNYIDLREQVEIIKKCRELGLGPGGFYQPGYQDGAKLRLQMMCLGQNWDPETRKYGNRHPIDGSESPAIPREFSTLVKKAIQDSHALIKERMRATNVEDILPEMSTDICIVNFYSTSGRLGLHQDRDESKESLLRRLPVVSLSIGDSAEFLYGDGRDIDEAEKVLLESGDVLIFGGKSRHIFHGVRTIVPNSAPLALLEESNLRPGRLNLTFRQF